MKIKETKQLKSGLWRLYESNSKLVGIDIWNEQEQMTMNETWTKAGCEELVAAGKMKFFDEEYCVTEQEVEFLWKQEDDQFVID